MSRTLRKLMRLAQEEHRPVFLYDTTEDRATVLLDFESYERQFSEAYDFEEELFEEEKEYSDFDLNSEDLSPSQSMPILSFEEQEAIIDQKNRDLALYQARREEKEREEIAKILERELEENPPLDPFEEDFLRSAQWHEAVDTITALDLDLSPTPPEEEPSYHPIVSANVDSPVLNWGEDWQPLKEGLKPIPYVPIETLDAEKGENVSQNLLDEEPIFLEEPL